MKSGIPKLAEHIIGLAGEIQAQLVEWRRDIHTNPELGFYEVRTSGLVSQVLMGLGLEVSKGINGTGVVALLRGKKEGATVALRADMDALPIEEQGERPYKSRNPGVMHACGHDAHVAILLGTALVLVKLRNELRGNVKFIFQPCEETPPGGAEGMISAGVLDNPLVDAIFGLHVNPNIPTGMIAYKEGAIMASADSFELIIKGKGGHAGSPHQTVDAVVVAAQVITALQTIVSRQRDPLAPVVVSLGTINGGYANNVVAEKVVITGTIRTLEPQLRKEIPQKLIRVVEGITSAFSADYEFNYDTGYPPVINDKELTDLLVESAGEILGKHKVMEAAQPSMGGEDFAYYLEKVPGSFFNLGVGKAGEEVFPWHHPRFDLDEDALHLGVGIMAYNAIKFLKEKAGNN